MSHSSVDFSYPSMDRRKVNRCLLPIRTQRFIKFWPLALSFVYATVGFWPSPVFGGNEDTFYQILALIIAGFGIVSTIFWEKHILRNIMTSVALARSASIIALALIADPPQPYSAIMRLTGAGILAVIFFCLTIVETPHLKAMRNGS